MVLLNVFYVMMDDQGSGCKNRTETFFYEAAESR